MAAEKQCDDCIERECPFYEGDEPYPCDCKATEDEILSRAIQTYGEPAQVLKCIEELAELGYELSLKLCGTDRNTWEFVEVMQSEFSCIMDWCRGNVEPGDLDLDCGVNNEPDITSELADVSITTSQMLKIFTTPEEFEMVKQAKLTRLEERMNGGDSQ